MNSQDESKVRAGRFLRQLRKNAAKTQREAAKDIGLDYYTFISQVETGHSRLPAEMWEAVAKSYAVSPQGLAKNLLKFYDPCTYKILFGPITSWDPDNTIL